MQIGSHRDYIRPFGPAWPIVKKSHAAMGSVMAIMVGLHAKILNAGSDRGPMAYYAQANTTHQLAATLTVSIPPSHST
jgi:hypothetical protein